VALYYLLFVCLARGQAVFLQTRTRILYFAQHGVQEYSLEQTLSPHEATRDAIRGAYVTLVERDEEGFAVEGSTWHRFSARLVWAKSPAPLKSFVKRYNPWMWYTSMWTEAEVAAIWWVANCF
jgi:hypothetical protein